MDHSPTLAPRGDTLSQLLLAVCNASPHARSRVAKRIAVFFEMQSRELSGELLARLVLDLNNRINALIRSPKTNDRLGAIATIDQLIDVVAKEDDATSIAVFAEHILLCLQIPVRETLTPATQTLGRLASAGTSTNVSRTWIDKFIHQSFDWLHRDGRDNQIRRLAGIMLLNEICRNAHTIFYQYIQACIRCLSSVLFDPSIEVRETATMVLGGSLELVVARHNPSSSSSKDRLRTSSKVVEDAKSPTSSDAEDGDERMQPHTSKVILRWFDTIFNAAVDGMRRNTDWSIHGSLLTFGEMLRRLGSNRYMKPRLPKVYELVLKVRDRRDKNIRKTVLSLMPRLAQYQPSYFIQNHMDLCLKYILAACAKKGSTTTRERGEAFLSLGRVALAVEDAIVPHMKRIVPLLQKALTVKHRRHLCQEALLCISMLARATPHSIPMSGLDTEMPSLLEQMFSEGLVPKLIEALRELMDVCEARGARTRPIRRLVQKLLINQISQVLTGKDYKHPGEALVRGLHMHGHAALHRRQRSGPSLVRQGSKGLNVEDEKHRIYRHDKQNRTSEDRNGRARKSIERDGDRKSKSRRGMDARSDSTSRENTGRTNSVSSASSSSSSPPTKHAIKHVGPQRTPSRWGSLLSIVGLSTAEKKSRQNNEGGRVDGRPNPTEIGRLQDLVSSPMKGSAIGVGVGGSKVEGRDRAAASGVISPIPSSSAAFDHERDLPLVMLALKTLGTFPMPDVMLLGFCRSCVVPFLTDREPSVRRQAAIACANLLLRPGVPVPKRSVSSSLVCDILQRLLEVAIGDPVQSVRFAVLEALFEPKFDAYLAQATNLRVIFIALNDEVFRIRLSAMRLIARLTDRNPAYIMPALRQTLVQILSELKYGSSPKPREEGARLLSHLISAAPTLVRPYLSAILRRLLPRLGDKNAAVVTAVLGTIERVAATSVGSARVPTLVHRMETFIPRILDNLEDLSSARKRQMALAAMSRIIVCTGSAVDPFLRYPSLLQVVLDILRQGAVQPWPLRKEAMKLLGVVGAIDPDHPHPTLRQILARETYYKIRDPRGLGRGHDPRAGALVYVGHMRASAVSDDGFDRSRNFEYDRDTSHESAPLGHSVNRKGSSLENEGNYDDMMRMIRGDGSPKHHRHHPRLRRLTDRRDRTNGRDKVDDPDGEEDEDADAFAWRWEGELLPSMLPAEEYYPTVAIRALLAILNDSSMQRHHAEVVRAIMFIFKSLRLKCVPYLPRVLGCFLSTMRVCETGLRVHLFVHLAKLVRIVKQHIRNYLDEIFNLMCEYWDEALENILELAEHICVAIRGQFNEYLPRLFPYMLRELTPTRRRRPNVLAMQAVLRSLDVFGSSLEQYLYLLIPTLIRVIEMPVVLGDVGARVQNMAQIRNRMISASESARDHSDKIKHGAIRALGKLAREHDFSDYASRIIHSLTRVVQRATVGSETVSPTMLDMGGISSRGVDDSFDLYGGEAGVHHRDLVNSTFSLLNSHGHSQHGASASGLHDFSVKERDALLALQALNTLCTLVEQLGAEFSALWMTLEKLISPPKSSRKRSSSEASSSLQQHLREKHHRWYKYLAKKILQKNRDLAAGTPWSSPYYNEQQLNRNTSSSLFDGKGESRVFIGGESADSNNSKGGGDDVGNHERFGLVDASLHDIGGGSFADRRALSRSASNGSSTGLIGGHSSPIVTDLEMNQPKLIQAFEASLRSTKEDWIEWMNRISELLLLESPSPALRSCSELKQLHRKLARELFNAAFVSCWGEMGSEGKAAVLRALEIAFRSTTIPAEILQTLLKLAEFMEHDDKPLPINSSTLSSLAEQCHAYAKALHYKEDEFQHLLRQSRDEIIANLSGVVESLISINSKLDQPEAAIGILKFAQSKYAKAIKLREGWYEKLNRWEDALAGYERKVLQVEDDDDEKSTASSKTKPGAVHGSNSIDASRGNLDNVLGMMRCLHVLMHWDKLESVAENVWPRLSAGTKRELAPMLTLATWGLGRWERMRHFSDLLDENASENSFFKAVLAVHDGRLDAARDHVARARVLLSSVLTPLLAESYNRAYSSLVMVQKLAELDEIITLKKLVKAGKVQEAGSYRHHLERTWRRRISGCQQTVDVWFQILQVRSLLVPPGEERNIAHHSSVLGTQGTQKSVWVKYATLCRKSGRFALSLNTLLQLGACSLEDASLPHMKHLLAEARSVGVAVNVENGVADVGKPKPAVRYALYKHAWAAGYRAEALKQLDGFVREMATNKNCPGHHDIELRVRCHIKLGQYRQVLQGYGSGNVDLDSGSQGGRRPSIGSGPTTTKQQFLRHLRPRPHHLTWQKQQHIDTSDKSDPDAAAVLLASLRDFDAARRLDPNAYSAWHAWAKMNFDAAQHYRKVGQNDVSMKYVVPAVQGFFKSIGLARTSMNRDVSSHLLEDMLRLLTLWFLFGSADGTTCWCGENVKSRRGSKKKMKQRTSASNLSDPSAAAVRQHHHHQHDHRSSHHRRMTDKVHDAFRVGFESPHIGIGIWLQVTPQLIARIQTPNAKIREVLTTLLTRVGKTHPQALIYALTVASNSSQRTRKEAATQVLTAMRRDWGSLVDAAQIVSKELVRVAILWPEIWHEGLEDASRLYFGDKSVSGMLAAVFPLHKILNDGPQTPSERSFVAEFGKDLDEAQKRLNRYVELSEELKRRKGELDDEEIRSIEARQEKHLRYAWDLYYHVFRVINKELPSLTKLELEIVSPKLLSARDLELAVPGMYRAGKPVVRITRFASSVSVLGSKQRPRQIQIRGSDGRLYNFLLKGHEDLRQDERVMQLFGLINRLLRKDPLMQKHDDYVEQYDVIPLSHKVGVVQWVPKCDTLHQLIRENREGLKIPLNDEHRRMLQLAPDFDTLTLMQKLEVFEYALKKTTGNDLRRLLWNKSANSEVWLVRRTNYTRSLAVMSMVGYILGLGDRHPSNLMLHRRTGKLVHIDFGDCFEVAQHREKYPEKIPFRLTRMLVKAMGVSGVEGTFRGTCEKVMRVLRGHRDSVMAMLETFVHDPLINWRLLVADADESKQKDKDDDEEEEEVDNAGNDARKKTKSADSVATAGSEKPAPIPIVGNSRQSGVAAAVATKGDLALTTTTTTTSENKGAVDDDDDVENSANEGEGEDADEDEDGASKGRDIASPTKKSSRRKKAEDKDAVDTPRMENVAASLRVLKSFGALSRAESVRVTDRNASVVGSMAQSSRMSLRKTLDREGSPPEQTLNKRAVEAIQRVRDKLSGRDFGKERRLDVDEQVERLIQQATSKSNLCQCYIGWCPFW